MQPYTPESLCSVAPDLTPVMLELFFQQGTGRGWAAGSKRARRRNQRLLTTGGPQAAEEEASLGRPRGLVPEEEEGLPSPAVLWLTLLLNT